MPGNSLIRLIGTVFLGAVILTTSLTAMAAVAHSEKGNVLCAGVADSVGLVLDKHQNLYMAERSTGLIYCVPPSSSPILLAKIPGQPTALAVDSIRTVFVSTENGTIYRIGLDGSVNEAYRCPKRPIGLSVDRDGGLIIATVDGVIRRVERRTLTMN